MLQTQAYTLKAWWQTSKVVTDIPLHTKEHG